MSELHDKIPLLVSLRYYVKHLGETRRIYNENCEVIARLSSHNEYFKYVLEHGEDELVRLEKEVADLREKELIEKGHRVEI